MIAWCKSSMLIQKCFEVEVETLKYQYQFVSHIHDFV